MCVCVRICIYSAYEDVILFSPPDARAITRTRVIARIVVWRGEHYVYIYDYQPVGSRSLISRECICIYIPSFYYSTSSQRWKTERVRGGGESVRLKTFSKTSSLPPNHSDAYSSCVSSEYSYRLGHVRLGIIRSIVIIILYTCRDLRGIEKWENDRISHDIRYRFSFCF